LSMSNLIRDSKTFQIPSMMQTGKADGMRLMDDSIVELLEKEMISLDQALENIAHKKRLAGFMAATDSTPEKEASGAG
ncbi:MAG: hypothetical protein V3R28_00565, partial [Desulfatiglandales bacterium]